METLTFNTSPLNLWANEYPLNLQRTTFHLNGGTEESARELPEGLEASTGGLHGRDAHSGRSNDGHSLLLCLLDQLPREGLRDAFGDDGDGPDLEMGTVPLINISPQRGPGGSSQSRTHLPAPTRALRTKE